MKITPISARHFQLTQLGLVNAFLVREEDGFTLIDTCFQQAHALFAAAQELGAPIRRIALTHAHNDHASSVDGLIKLIPETQLLLSKREARLLAGDKTLGSGEPARKLRGDFVTTKARPNRLLNEGDLVGSLRVIETPGHTPGQIAFIDQRDGTLFAGDAWSVAGGLAVAGDLRLTFPFPAWGTWSPELAVESARKLLALRPSMLCVGHGQSLSDPVKQMEHALLRASTRLSQKAKLRQPKQGGTAGAVNSSYDA